MLGLDNRKINKSNCPQKSKNGLPVTAAEIEINMEVIISILLGENMPGT
jgi:hypothetical protein